MNTFYKTLLINSSFALGCCLFSCKNEPNAVSQQTLILGKWNLQQQHVLLLRDGVKTVDTVYTANAATNTYAYAVFNSDGTDSTRSVYNPGNLNLQTNAPGPSAASSVGTYSIMNSTFNGSFGIAGWFSYAVGSSGVTTPGSAMYKIMLLNASNLNVQGQVSFTVTNSGTHTYQETSYYYYTK
jgi:hypothetical protein